MNRFRPSTQIDPKTPREAAALFVKSMGVPLTPADYQRELKNPRSPLRRALDVLRQEVWLEEEVEIQETLAALDQKAAETVETEREEYEEEEYRAEQKSAQRADDQPLRQPATPFDFGKSIFSDQEGLGLVALLQSLSSLLRRWLGKKLTTQTAPLDTEEAVEKDSSRYSLRTLFGLFKRPLRPALLPDRRRSLSPEELEELMRQEGYGARTLSLRQRC